MVNNFFFSFSMDPNPIDSSYGSSLLLSWVSSSYFLHLSLLYNSLTLLRYHPHIHIHASMVCKLEVQRLNSFNPNIAVLLDNSGPSSPFVHHNNKKDNEEKEEFVSDDDNYGYDNILRNPISTLFINPCSRFEGGNIVAKVVTRKKLTCLIFFIFYFLGKLKVKNWI